MKTPMQEAIEKIDEILKPLLEARKEEPDLLDDVDLYKIYDLQSIQEYLNGMLEKEKEVMCDFVEYCIQRHRDFIDGDLPSREYEGDTGEMFEWRYADKAKKAKMTRERNKFWKEADEMRREREEKFKQELK